jgi:predicted HicB family RNase H-like nuclease
MSKKKKTPSTAHYQKIVYWSDEDGCFVGKCPALFLGGVHGDDEAKVYAELLAVVAEHLDDLRKEGLPAPTGDAQEFSGKLTLRINPALHRALVLRANVSGGSLNGHIERLLTESLR